MGWGQTPWVPHLSCILARLCPRSTVQPGQVGSPPSRVHKLPHSQMGGLGGHPFSGTPAPGRAQAKQQRLPGGEGTDPLHRPSPAAPPPQSSGGAGPSPPRSKTGRVWQPQEAGGPETTRDSARLGSKKLVPRSWRLRPPALCPSQEGAPRVCLHRVPPAYPPRSPVLNARPWPGGVVEHGEGPLNSIAASAPNPSGPQPTFLRLSR